MKKSNNIPEYDDADLLRHMALPAEKKLEYLEELNEFLSQTMPESSKKIWEELKKSGW